MDTHHAIEDLARNLAARQAIAEASKPPMILKFYSVVVGQVLKLLHRHGLGQTLAYIQLRAAGKPGSPYSLLGRQIDRWLVTNLGISAASTLAALTSRDSRFYLEATEQTWLFVRAVRRELEKSS